MFLAKGKAISTNIAGMIIHRTTVALALTLPLALALALALTLALTLSHSNAHFRYYSLSLSLSLALSLSLSVGSYCDVLGQKQSYIHKHSRDDNTQNYSRSRSLRYNVREAQPQWE